MLEDISRLFLNVKEKIKSVFILNKEYPKGFFDNVGNRNSEGEEITKGIHDRIDKKLVSLDEKIKNINNETSKNLQECQNKYDEISQKIQNIKKDFIELSQMSGSLEGKVNGIDTKLENKWNKLEKFGNEINALMNQGKEMLGITTIASLAESYKNTRISYEKEMIKWQLFSYSP